jgi:alanine racemase
MDTVTVDVTQMPVANLHSETWFDLIDDVQDINALASQAGTSAYEILTNLGAHYWRHYITP